MPSLLILGGGIVGTGVARDAALRGIDVTLLEQETLGCGTSSRSSRLIHGGIRYLELGDVALVRESLRERATLLRIAPHLVQPVPFLFVLDRGAWWQWLRTGVGVLAYRLLAGRQALGPHHPLSRQGLLDREPLLADAPLLGGAIYQDAQCDDLGLVRANAMDAKSAGARIIERARATVHLDDAGVTARLPDGTSLRADALVLATGPWTDTTRAAVGLPARHLVGGTKGIHIAFPWARLPLRCAIALRHPTDQRVMFAIPEPSRQRVFFGTTDTATDEAPEALTIDAVDEDYLLRAAQHLFPTHGLHHEEISDRWVGVRPLLRQQGAESRRTREHLLLREGRALTVAGGKLTTYRSMAEAAVDQVGLMLGVPLPPSVTAARPLPSDPGA